MAGCTGAGLSPFGHSKEQRAEPSKPTDKKQQGDACSHTTKCRAPPYGSAVSDSWIHPHGKSVGLLPPSGIPKNLARWVKFRKAGSLALLDPNLQTRGSQDPYVLGGVLNRRIDADCSLRPMGYESSKID